MFNLKRAARIFKMENINFYLFDFEGISSVFKKRIESRSGCIQEIHLTNCDFVRIF